MNTVPESEESESSVWGPSSVEKIDTEVLPADGIHADGIHVDRLSESDIAAAYERHAAEILRYAIRCVGRREIAEELASEAFLKMYQHRDRIDSSRAAAWLTTIVKNLATDYWRRSVLERRHSMAIPSLEQRAPTQEALDELLAEPSLKPEHRACLTLHYVHGMERREIMSHTGLSDNQVKSCLQYGLKLLRKARGVSD